MNNENGILLELPSQTPQIIVKFKSNVGARLKGAQLTSSNNMDISNFTALLTKNKKVTMTRLFDQTEQELELDVSSVRQSSGQEISELSGYYILSIEDEAKAKTF